MLRLCSLYNANGLWSDGSYVQSFSHFDRYKDKLLSAKQEFLCRKLFPVIGTANSIHSANEYINQVNMK
jgi:hypothetical protein